MTRANTNLHPTEALIAGNLRTLRKASGLTIAQFAQALNERVVRSVTTTTIADMEAGRIRIDAHTMLEASHILSCSPLDILGTHELPSALQDDDAIALIQRIKRLPTKEQKRLFSVFTTLLSE